MSTPQLSQIKELPLPTPPFSYWPQTWGWLALLLVILVAIGILAFLRWQRWHRDQYRREALARLAELEQSLSDSTQRLPALREVPELLKRVALSMPGAPAVASLGGDDWQAFLQRSSSTPLPSDIGRQLSLLAYAPAPRLAELSDNQARELLGTCRHWIETHHVAA